MRARSLCAAVVVALQLAVTAGTATAGTAGAGPAGPRAGSEPGARAGAAPAAGTAARPALPPPGASLLRPALDATSGHVDPPPPGVDLHRPPSLSALRAAVGLDGVGPQQPALAAPGGYVAPGTSSVPGLTGHVPTTCDGTGTDGRRVALLYVREIDSPDRYADVVDVLRSIAADTDDAFAVSAAKTGGGKRVRWVCDPQTGAPVVADVVVPDGGLADFSSTVRSLVAAGHDLPDRKYQVFAEASVYCGLGELYRDSRPTSNHNDASWPMYARNDTACWAAAAAHELLHNLGAVQDDAPHSTGAGHCNDESDRMCYPDGGPTGTMTRVCPEKHERLFDCGDDDYFAAAPAPGSYLATHWNTANSSYLFDAPPLGPAPAVAVEGLPATVLSGQQVRLTATSSAPGTTFRWTSWCSGQSPDPSGATWLLTCPRYADGTQVPVAVEAVTPGGRTGRWRGTTTLRQAAPPTARIVAPASVRAGEPATFRAQVEAVGAVTYEWSAPLPCRGSDLHRTTLQLTCPPEAVGSLVRVGLRVRQGDGHPAWDSADVVPVRRTALRTTLRLGPPDRLTATLRNATSGAPVPATALQVQTRLPGAVSWPPVTVVATDARGQAGYSPRPGRARSYRFVFAGDAHHLAAAGPAVLVKTPVRVTLSSRAGEPRRLTARLTTADGRELAGRQVLLQRRDADGWTTVRSALTDPRGRARWTVPQRATTSYRAAVAATAVERGDRSGSVRVRG